MEIEVEGAEVQECSSRLKRWRWRLRGCSLRLRGCSLGLRGEGCGAEVEVDWM